MKYTILILCLFIFSFGTLAQSDLQRKAHFNLLKNDLAIACYDPVSYFQNKPTEGQKGLEAAYKGLKYRFANKENQERFLKNQASYEPQYGGWCAYAMGAKGQKVEVNPETYKIINGKLYLFYNAYFNNTLKLWNKDEENLKQAADLNWQKTLKK